MPWVTLRIILRVFYVDAVETASGAYQQNQQFHAPKDLLIQLGVSSNAKVDQEAAKAELIQAAKEADQQAQAEDSLTGVDITEELTQVAAQVDEIGSAWKSEEGWGQSRTQYLEQCTTLSVLVDNSDGVLDDISALIQRTQSYIDSTQISDVVQFDKVKALLNESFDVIIASGNDLVGGGEVDDFSSLMEQL